MKKIFFRRNLQGKCVSAPQPEQESIFRTVFAGRVRFGGVFRRSLRATTKKRSSTFFGKSAPPDKILATPMCLMNFHRVCRSSVTIATKAQSVPKFIKDFSTSQDQTFVHSLACTFGITAVASSCIRVARGCCGCTCTPEGGEKILGVIYREN